MDICKQVGANIRRLRKQSALAQEELAARMGVDQGYVSRLESGKVNSTITTIWFAAQALGVGVEVLFSKHPAQPQETAASKWPRKGEPFIGPDDGGNGAAEKN